MHDSTFEYSLQTNQRTQSPFNHSQIPCPLADESHCPVECSNRTLYPGEGGGRGIFFFDETHSRSACTRACTFKYHRIPSGGRPTKKEVKKASHQGQWGVSPPADCSASQRVLKSPTSSCKRLMWRFADSSSCCSSCEDEESPAPSVEPCCNRNSWIC